MLSERFYDADSKVLVSRVDAANRLSPRSNRHLAPDSMIIGELGYWPVQEYAVPPDGEFIIAGTESVVEVDGVAVITYQTETQAQLDARVAADRAVEEAKEVARIAGLAQAYGKDLIILNALLSIIGLEIPCTEAAAKARIETLIMATQLAPNDGVIGNLFGSWTILKSIMNVDDIPAVWQVVKTAQGL